MIITRAISGPAGPARSAGIPEIVCARLWNLLNEGRSFHLIFSLAVFLIYHLFDLAGGRWLPVGIALAAGAPVAAVSAIWDFPLHLRWFLWIPLTAWVSLAGSPDLTLSAMALGVYVLFTVFIWGSLYYHLRIGTPLNNFTRFWRLVAENSDSTSGNIQEHAPKALLTLNVMQWAFLASAAGDGRTLVWPWVFGAVLAVYAWGLHCLLFNWKPSPVISRGMANRMADLMEGAGRAAGDAGTVPVCHRAYVVVIDGCRPDKLRLADTPFLDRLAQRGTVFTRMETVYPARTVVCFSSMLTGASPREHGIGSNLVLSHGVKCESLFDSLRSAGKKGLLLGCAHLYDAFGDDCRTFTALAHNDRVDGEIMARAREMAESENPELLVVQLLAVDQTGHSRGAHFPEYLEKIAEADRHIAAYYGWLERRGLLDDAVFAVMADHGQSRGIGGHGHLDEGERYVPFILAGKGIAVGRVVEAPASLMSLAPTLAGLLGIARPSAAKAPFLASALESAAGTERRERLTVVIPARNEAATVGDVVARVPRGFFPGLEVSVLVVDDGSVDGTAAAAREAGADLVIPGPARGLGAAVRLGFDKAHRMGSDYVVLIDADGEYPPEGIPELVAPLRLGEADYILGSRFRGYIRRMRLSRRLGNYAFTLLQSVLLGIWLTDGQTGMRALNRAALSRLKISHDYNYAQVMTLRLVRQGFRLAEVPISYAAHPDPGRSFVRLFPYLRHVLPAIWREMVSDSKPAPRPGRLKGGNQVPKDRVVKKNLLRKLSEKVWLRLLASMLAVLTGVFPVSGPAEAYSYGAVETEPIAEAYKSVAAAVGRQPPDWAGARAAYASVRAEVEKDAGGPAATAAFETAVKAGDTKLTVRVMQAIVLGNLERRLNYARGNLQDYSKAKTLVNKAVVTYDSLSPAAKAVSADLDAKVRTNLDRAMDAIGSPGVLGVGVRAPKPEEFDQARAAILSSLRPQFGLDFAAVTAKVTPKESAPASGSGGNDAGEPRPGSAAPAGNQPAADSKPAGDQPKAETETLPAAPDSAVTGPSGAGPAVSEPDPGEPAAAMAGEAQASSGGTSPYVWYLAGAGALVAVLAAIRFSRARGRR